MSISVGRMAYAAPCSHARTLVSLPLLLPVLALLLATACRFDLPPQPGGTHHTYVVSQTLVPTSNPQATEFGLDLNDDGVVDNQLGSVFAALVTQGLDVQDSMTRSIDRGDTILLLDLQTTSFSNTDSKLAGLQLKLGDKASATPAPCANTSDMVCRQHLTGTGAFSVAVDSPDHAALTGRIQDDTFVVDNPGALSLSITLGSPQGASLDLIGARAKASGMSETGIDQLILAGAMLEEDVTSKLIPMLHAQLLVSVMASCTGTVPPGCGCVAGSTGANVINRFDNMPKDCVIKPEEVANNTLIKSLIAPDITFDGRRALSLGIKVSAVRSTIR